MITDRVVVWDYDGTLVDTRAKNLNVTRLIIPAVSGRPVEEFPALATPEAYGIANRRSANWRELYGKEFGLTDGQVNEAGRLWTRYQLEDKTPATFFNGMAAAIDKMRDLPQVIFSQNSRDNILQALGVARLSGYFALVVGYEEVGFERQKPAPDGLLFCLEELGFTQGTVFYAGDHDTDIELARRANSVLRQNKRQLKVFSIGAEFCAGSQETWQIAPDYVVRRPEEVAELVINRPDMLAPGRPSD